MGNWNINIQGIGSHHNNAPSIDADLMAIEFVAFLRSKGQVISSATFTSGSIVDLQTASQPSSKLVHGKLNGMPWEFNSVVSYDDIVYEYSDPKGSSPNRNFSIKYYKARFGKEGILHRGEKIDVCDGVVFTVADTSNA